MVSQHLSQFQPLISYLKHLAQTSSLGCKLLSGIIESRFFTARPAVVNGLIMSLLFLENRYQHKEWLNILNELHERLLDGEYINIDEATTKSLRMMEKYALMHFASEEEYMRKISYPEIERHMEIHQEMSKKIKQYRDDISEGRLVLNPQLMKVLQNWLQDHILGEDLKYSNFATQNK